MTARAAAVVALIALTACGDRVEPPPSGPARLVVAFTGEDLGRVEPCGCTSAMLGGLARRPARIASCVEPGVPFAYVSGGRLVAGTGAYDRMRLRTILRALKTMNCAAVAPTAAEIALGATPLPRVVKLPTAGVDAYAAASLDVRAEIPAGAALVVMTDLDGDAARGLAKSAAAPTLILYADGLVSPRAADVVAGGVAVAPYPAKGESVGVARLVGDAWAVEYRPVLHDLPESPEIATQRLGHLAEMRAARLVETSASDGRFVVGRAPETNARRYVGQDGCAACHAEAVDVWKASKHAQAMATLAATGDDVDPGCVKCHVVAYGTGAAFRDAKSTPGFAAVGCESCHGGRAGHAEERRADPVTKRKPAPAGAASCVGCHDDEHDPNFDFASYWPRIVHGAR